MGFFPPTQIIQQKQCWFGPYHFTCTGALVILVIAVWLEERYEWNCTRVNSKLALFVRAVSLLLSQIPPNRKTLAFSLGRFHFLTIIFSGISRTGLDIWNHWILHPPQDNQKTQHGLGEPLLCIWCWSLSGTCHNTGEILNFAEAKGAMRPLFLNVFI